MKQKERKIKIMMEVEFTLPEANMDDFNNNQQAISLMNETFEQSNLPYEGIGVTVLSFNLITSEDYEVEVEVEKE